MLAVIAVAGVVVLATAIDRRLESATAPSRTWRDGRLSVTASDVAYKFRAAPTPEVDLDADIRAFEDRIARSPTPQDLGDLASAYLRRAQRNQTNDDYAKAEAAAQRSLSLMPEPNGAEVLLAKVATARHEFRAAIEIASAYVKKSASVEARIVLATAYLAVGELPAAADAAESAVSTKPATNTYVMRALVLQAQGRDAEAWYDFSRAVAVEEYGDPQESARTRALWGRFAMRRGDLASAEVLYAAALKILPDFALATAYLGEARLRAGRAKEARALYDQAFAASHEVRYLMDQARATELIGDKPGADQLRTQVERLVRGELEQHGFGHRLDLVEILVDRGRPADLDEAIRLATDEVARRPSADTQFQLARAYARNGNLIDAQMHARAALATGARDARLYELAARVETALGNPGRGAVYAAEAGKLDPNNAGWRTLGIVIGKPRAPS